MSFLKNDLTRNLGLGFVLGVLGMVIANPALAQVMGTLV